MKKTLINLSLLVVLPLAACDTYKNHADTVTKVERAKCTESATLNSNCKASDLSIVKNEDDNKKKELPEPEVMIAKSKNSQ